MRKGVAFYAVVLAVTLAVSTRSVAAQPKCTAAKTSVDTELGARSLRQRAGELKPANAGEAAKLVEAATALDALETEAAQVDELKVTGGDARVTVHLANPPSARLRMSFDRTNDGRHVEVEWDPAVQSELTRTVTLPVGDWMVVASVEPLTFTQSSGTVVVQTRFGGLATHGNKLRLTGTYVAMIAALGVSPDSSQRNLSLWPKPTLSLSCNGLPSLDSARFPVTAGAGAGSGLRGFGPVPTALTETLSLLAEIAVDRTKSGAMKLLQKRLVDPFCGNTDTRITLAKLGLGWADELALPRTCELLRNLRLEAILSSGRALLVALRDDLRYTVAPAGAAAIGRADPLLHAAVNSFVQIANRAIDGGGVDSLAAQLAIEALAKIERLKLQIPAYMQVGLSQVLKAILHRDAALVTHLQRVLDVTCTNDCVPKVAAALVALASTPFGDWSSDPKLIATLRRAIDDNATVNTLVGHACQARLAVAVIKRCSKDGCSAHDVADMIERPAQHFAVDNEAPFAACWTQDKSFRSPGGELATLQQVVVDGIRVVAPALQTEARDRAKAIVKIALALIDRWLDDTSMGQRRRLQVEALAETAIALIDEDYATALVRFVRLVAETREGRVPVPVSKLIQLVGAVATYSTVYRDTKAADPEAARAARKEALTAIIDNATDRSERDDVWIVSIGSNVGLSATFVDAFDSEAGSTRFDPGVRIPLGIAVDSELWWGKSIGLRIGVQLIDLGQFVRRNDDDELADVQWADFVSPGVEVGLSLAFLGRPLNLSAHASYAPSIEVGIGDGLTQDGAWRFGAAVSYYVPFFDLN